MNRHLLFFGLAFTLFLVLDFFWLGFLMSDFYQNQLGMLARRGNGSFTPYIPAAILVYLLFIVGLVLFVFPKVMDKPVGLETFIWSSLYGLIMYGVYELTNLAVLANWPIKLVYVDIVWGAIISGLTTSISIWIMKYFGF